MLWLIEDLHGLLSPLWAQIALVITSVACGAIVGAELEKREKPAGLRTMILVCLGATLFTMVSYAFATTTGDSGRVAAQIVTGIGFLGAGAILHGSGLVRGMTTAATIWSIAAVGMVVGIGYAGAGLGLSLLVRVVLAAALALEGRALGVEQEFRIELVFKTNGGKTRIQIEKIMEDFHLYHPLMVESASEETERAVLQYRLHRSHRREFLNEIARLPEVKEIKKLQ